MVSMNAAAQLGPQISQPLTWDEICNRYPDQWVCLVEIDRPRRNDFEFRTARVVGHGPEPRDPWVHARMWWAHYGEIAHYFTGPIVGPRTVFLA
jgi:hypothetical protein